MGDHMDVKFVGVTSNGETTNGTSKERYFVEVNDVSKLENMKPDFQALAKLDSTGVIVTSGCSKGDYDFFCRYWRNDGTGYEDPVTGSAQCALTPYWEEALGKSTLSSYQMSARGGALFTESNDDRILISGEAVTVFTSELSKATLE